LAPDAIGFGFVDLHLAHGTALRTTVPMLVRVDLLFLDPRPPVSQQRRDLMETIEDRHGCGSILATSQLAV